MISVQGLFEVHLAVPCQPRRRAGSPRCATCRRHYAARFRWSIDGPANRLRVDARRVGVLPRSRRPSPGLPRNAPARATACRRDHAVASVGTGACMQASHFGSSSQSPSTGRPSSRVLSSSRLNQITDQRADAALELCSDRNRFATHD